MFLVGFRNLLGKESHGESYFAESVALPTSSYYFVTFVKMMDNPDVLENFLAFWNDTVIKKMKEKEKYDIDKLVDLTEEQISKVYPIVYNPTFRIDEHNVYQAAECYTDDHNLKETRKTLLLNSLNDRELDYIDKKNKKATPIVLDNAYKPFNVRELDSASIFSTGIEF